VKFKKIAEWEDHDTQPGGDVGFLLEAIDGSLGRHCYARISWSVLTDEEFAALYHGEIVNLADPGEHIDSLWSPLEEPSVRRR
jgi:hypothetical protein